MAGRGSWSLPFTHSLIHSFEIPVHPLDARHCSERWENGENKTQSLPPWSVHSSASITGSPVLASAPPAWEMNAGPSAPPASQGPPCPMSYASSSAPRKHQAFFSSLMPGASSRHCLRLHSDRGDLVLLQKRQTKTQGTQASRCHRDQPANEMVFLKVRGQAQSPSLMHKA